MSPASNRPPLTPEPSAGRPTPQFLTEGLDFSAGLLATAALRYVGAENVGDGRCQFRFLDPEGVGAQLEVDYATGRFPKVDPMALFKCKAILQDAMRAALSRNGGGYDGRSR